MQLIIRHADICDLDAIKRIADANRESIGFVMRPALVNGIQKRWLLVVEIDGQIVGFAHYRHRLDDQTTLYELCVRQDKRGQGIGRALIGRLWQESQTHGKIRLRLKTPVDLSANGFYRHIGFRHVGQEAGKKRSLNVWEREDGSNLLCGWE